jgi:putative transposase
MEKFQNRYQVATARADWWDYNTNGIYFITICTSGRECYFGFIKNKILVLSETGMIAKRFWSDIPKHFPFVQLGEFVVMPDHIHGILIINQQDAKPIDAIPVSNSESNSVETLHATSLQPAHPAQPEKNDRMAAISPKPGSLAAIVRSYKSAVTKNARLIHTEFNWQIRFYDHIIRDDFEYQRITDYIIDNPDNWELKDHPGIGNQDIEC